MDIISPIIGPIVEYTIHPIGRQFSYLFFIRKNTQNLKLRLEMLKHTKESVFHKVNQARRNGENIESGVQNWLTKVDSIIEQSETLLNSLGGQGGLCLNLVQRHQLSRKAVKLADEVVEIKDEGNFDRISFRVPLSEVESSNVRTSDFVNFESRKPTVDKIIGALMDDKVHKIGLYGMGGVGKTMLVKEISRLVMEKKLFDEVVTSTISQTPDLKKIQGQLGDMLGLKFDQETEQGRALMLQKRLKMESRILVILDDVWKQIDLETIGIPSIEYHTGCKILFTSRDYSVLFHDMCTDENLEIKVLQEDETWSLFENVAGEIVETPDLKSIAVEVVRECAHLPIAIITVAKALRNKPLSIWKDALNQLRNPVVVNIRGMNEKVYSSLKLSYDQLDCEEAKLLFLLCSMFPEDHVIDVEDLHEYALSLGFLHGVDTVAQVRHRITKLVHDLLSSSLLLEESDYDWGVYVKMHDLVRDVAISISSKDDRICTLSYFKRLDDSWPEKQMSGNNHTVVYLNVKGLSNLPQKLMLPKVQLLVLLGPLLDGHELPSTFFGEMKHMKILELRSMNIPQLSPLLYSLANLQSLRLFDCLLGNINMIGELNILENLNLRGSDIFQIPATISQLTQLKVLNLSRCNRLKVIPPNIFVNLKNLEELNLGTFDGWAKEELNEGRRNVTTSELSCLSNLSALVLQIPNEKVVAEDLFSRFLNLEKFEISIGCKPLGTCSKKISRVLCLKMETTSGGIDDGIKMLLKRSERLHLIGSIGARVLPFELINQNESSHLKYLHIDDNSDFQHVIHGHNKALEKLLLNLERLNLSNLENFESMFRCHFTEFRFAKLKNIELLRCNKLGSLFYDFNMNDMLLNLEKIKIIDCEKLKTVIVMRSEKATDRLEFTNLKCLRLNGLPQLQTFYSKTEKLDQLSPDQNLEKDGTNKLFNDGSLFNQQVSFPNLEELTINKAPNLKMICRNVLIDLNSFSKIERVVIGKCNNLEKVFPSNIMSRLTCLQSLTIKSCKLLEGVFELEDQPSVRNKDIDLLPNLRYLELVDLPNLRYIWEKDHCEFLDSKSLSSLSIRDCPKLEAKYFVKVVHQLKRLEIDLSSLYEILRNNNLVLDGGESLFGKLEDLALYGTLSCYRGIDHLPLQIVSILHNVGIFRVGMSYFEEVFPMGSLDNKRPKLSILILRDLPKLRYLWNEDLQKNSSIFQNLEDLYISRCGLLNMFVPSSMSFRNLTWLHVIECHKLTYLLNPSIARSMSQLVYLNIRGCKRMTTVIAKEEEENGEILFNKLHDLLLGDMSKLLNIHYGKCTIRFPVLERIVLRNCPEMKDFSTGIVSTPHLLNQNIESYATGEFIPILKDYSKDQIIVEDINVAIQQVWENHCDANLQSLFEEVNLEEENQSDQFFFTC